MYLRVVGEDERKRIASLGGKSLKYHQRSFYRDLNLAKEAGRKGGLAKAAKAAAQRLDEHTSQ